MKKIIKTLSIVGIASSVALASNLILKSEKKVETNYSQDIINNTNELTASSNNNFKLNISTEGENIKLNVEELKNEFDDKLNNVQDTAKDVKQNITNKTSDLKNKISDELSNNELNTSLTTTDTNSSSNIDKPKTLEATKEDNIIPLPLVEDNFNSTDSPASYPMENPNLVNTEENESASVEDEDSINSENTAEAILIEEEITILEEINENLTNSVEDINNLLSELDFDSINEEDKQKLIEHVNFVNEKSNQLLEITNQLKCELGECIDNSTENVQDLTYRLNNLQNALESMQILNDYFSSNYEIFSNPQANIYGYSYTIYPRLNEDLDETGEEDNLQEDLNMELETENDTNNSLSENETYKTENNSLSDKSTSKTTKSKKNVDSFNTRYFTSNIDTYGPKRRNIDSFYNTALLDDFGGYGYNMPYNAYNNNFGSFRNDFNNNLNGLTSNNGYFNPEYKQNNEKKQETEVSQDSLNILDNPTNSDDLTALENKENTKNPITPEKTNPKRIKFAKNIDSYKGKTMNANINTMNGAKITDIVKSKFNKWFNKDKQAKKEIDSYVDNFIDQNLEKENQSAVLDNVDERNDQSLQNIVSTNAKPHRTKDIKEEDLIKNIQKAPSDIYLTHDPLTH